MSRKQHDKIIMMMMMMMMIKKLAEMFPEFSLENSHSSLGVTIGQMLTEMSVRKGDASMATNETGNQLGRLHWQWVREQNDRNCIL